MPRPLPPEQQEALEARGIVMPGAEREALPAEAVARVLGNVGLPHSERVQRLESDEETIDTTESIASPSYWESWQATYRTTSSITGLVGEPIPREIDIDLTMQLTELKPAFEVFERHELKPEVVLTPTHRSLDFWVNLVRAVQGSPLNPDQFDPYNPGQTRKVLRDGGLYVDHSVIDEWQHLTNPDGKPPAWQLSVASGLASPYITQVDSYGYKDNSKQLPSIELNFILKDLDRPSVLFQAGSQTPTQPDIHPTPESYLMHQLTRISQKKEPLDAGENAFCHLKGILSDDEVPVGGWNKHAGRQIRLLSTNRANNRLGIRPSVRADYA